MTIKNPYFVDGYSSSDAGYVVKNKFHGSREASFVCQGAAADYAKYANRMFKKHGTTEVKKWKGGK